MPFSPARAYRVSRSVALRPEPFGALAYDYDTRRLTFVRSRLLVLLLQSLPAFVSAGAAVESATASPEARRRLLRALQSLASSEVIHAC